MSRVRSVLEPVVRRSEAVGGILRQPALYGARSPRTEKCRWADDCNRLGAAGHGPSAMKKPSRAGWQCGLSGNGRRTEGIATGGLRDYSLLQMNPSVYIETTIPSYLTAWPSRDIVRAAHQQLTREWWEQRRSAFSLYISQFVLDEAGDGDPTAATDRINSLAGMPLLEAAPGALELAKRIMQAVRFPARAERDASHIAVAAWHGMDFLMTWNCTHINNAQLLPVIERTCREAGCSCPVICTPEELMNI